MQANLNLLQYQDQLQLKVEDGKKKVLCCIRNKFVVLQPEELVRQIFLHYLIKDLHYPIAKIAVEKGLRVNGRLRRFDILIYDKKIDPFILIECKAPHIDINQDVMDQVGQYNLPLKAKFLGLTNGINNIFCQLNREEIAYSYIDTLPQKN